VVDGGEFYSFYNLQCIKLDKERKYARKKISFYAYKKHSSQFFKMGSIPLLPLKLHQEMAAWHSVQVIKGAYWISSNSSFIQYCDSNIGLFSIAPHLVIALPTLR
jgi:hypothetical protein